MNTLTVDDILRGTELGRPQSVGHMQLIPLLGEDDESFAPPRVEVHTTAYGTVVLRNRADRPTIVPPGAGWIVKQSAQDHALGGGALLASHSEATITTARCIQSTQHGMIRAGEHPMLVLPAALRVQALATRKHSGCGILWEEIREFNRSHGVRAQSHLEHFLDHFARELQRFVAEFELLPRQLGAAVLVGGKLVGLERAPSAAFWRRMWEPLIRVCYGSLAVTHAANAATLASAIRVPLLPGAQSLSELRAQLDAVEDEEHQRIYAQLEDLRGLELRAAEARDQQLGGATLLTLASARLAGQVVHGPTREVQFASMSSCAPLEPASSAPSAPPAGPESTSVPTSVSTHEAAAAAQVEASWGERLRRWLFGVS